MPIFPKTSSAVSAPASSTYGLLNSSGGPSNYASSVLNTNYLPANYGTGYSLPASFNYTAPALSTLLPSSSVSNYTTMPSLTNRFNTANSASSLLSNPPAVKATSGGGNFLSNLSQTFQNKDVQGLLKMGAGFLIPTPKVEGAIPTSEDLLTKYKGMEISPEGTASKAKMLEYINNPAAIGGTATTEYVKNLNAQFDATDAQELAQFKSDWIARGYNPTGSDYTNAMNNLTEKQAIRRNTATSAAQVNLLNTQIQSQLQMIATAYGIDQQMLTELMNLDITEAAMKYGLSVEKVNQFRQAIYDMALSGVYNQSNPTGAVSTATNAVQNILGGQ
jgi:hypothetical protein